jgi:PAS domain-containing protein
VKVYITDLHFDLANVGIYGGDNRRLLTGRAAARGVGYTPDGLEIKGLTAPLIESECEELLKLIRSRRGWKATMGRGYRRRLTLLVISPIDILLCTPYYGGIET